MIIYDTQKILRKALEKKCTSVYNNLSKHHHLWDAEDFTKNVRPCTIMHQNRIIYDTQNILRKNICAVRIMDRNTIIYEIQNILRKGIRP